MNERDTVDREIKRYNVFGKNEKQKKKTERIFGERQGVRRYIVVVQPTAITKKNQCKKESLLH